MTVLISVVTLMKIESSISKVRFNLKRIQRIKRFENIKTSLTFHEIVMIHNMFPRLINEY